MHSMEMEANAGTNEMEDRTSISRGEGFRRKMNIFKQVRAGSGGRSIRWEDGRFGLSVNNGVIIAASAINDRVHTYEH